MKPLRWTAFFIFGALSAILVIAAAELLLSRGPIMLGHDRHIWIANDAGEVTIEIFHGRDFGKDHRTIYPPAPFRSSLSMFLLSTIPMIFWLALAARYLDGEKEKSDSTAI